MRTEDHVSEIAANHDAVELKRFWAARGADIKAWVESVGFTPSCRSAVFFVRSDLVNGLPTPEAFEAFRARHMGVAA